MQKMSEGIQNASSRLFTLEHGEIRAQLLIMLKVFEVLTRLTDFWLRSARLLDLVAAVEGLDVVLKKCT